MAESNPYRIVELSVEDLNVSLREPFGIATGAQPEARNLLVRVVLASGAVGYGEAAPFPAVNGETQEAARASLDRVRDALLGYDARAWRALGPWLRARIEHAPSARCAVETAVLDALCREHRVPLWVWFGGAGTTVETDLTVTTGTADAARVAATKLHADGFRTVKLKVGGVPLADDVARVRAVVESAPGCGVLLDANGAMHSVDDAVALVNAAREAGGNVVLFEQPMARDAYGAMREVAERAGVRVAADESVASAADVARVAMERAAQVINVKITKAGLVEALDVVAAARAHGMGLMVGGMVETPLALTVSACLAAGQGGFEFVDLDTALFMEDVPLEGGYARRGPVLDVSGIAAGHGVRPRR